MDEGYFDMHAVLLVYIAFSIAVGNQKPNMVSKEVKTGKLRMMLEVPRSAVRSKAYLQLTIRNESNRSLMLPTVITGDFLDISAIKGATWLRLISDGPTFPKYGFKMLGRDQRRVYLVAVRDILADYRIEFGRLELAIQYDDSASMYPVAGRVSFGRFIIHIRK